MVFRALRTSREVPAISPLQLSKELNSLELNSIIFNLRQGEIFRSFPRIFKGFLKRKVSFSKP